MSEESRTITTSEKIEILRLAYEETKTRETFLRNCEDMRKELRENYDSMLTLVTGSKDD